MDDATLRAPLQRVNSHRYMRFARTRDVLYGDFAVLKDLLVARGFDVCELQREGGGEFGHGGIDFRFPPGREHRGKHRDVRFGGKSLPATFDAADGRVWGAFAAPVWNESNRFRVEVRGRGVRFGPRAAALEADICAALGVVGAGEVKAAKRANRSAARAATRAAGAAKKAAAAARVAERAAAAAARAADERAFRVSMAENAMLCEEHGPEKWE